MTRYLFDTNHASALLRGNPQMFKRLSAMTPDDELSLCRPSVAELWYMVFNSARLDENQDRLIPFLKDHIIWEFDAEAATEYGRIRTELRKVGRPIPAIDVMIAAVARCQDLTVLSSDQHFRFVTNLRCENWLS
jgi:tRNA(fMet)-specific endonuclease VapC